MNDTDQYLTLANDLDDDAVVFPYPGSRFVIAQPNERDDTWEVAEYGFGHALVHGRGLSRGAAEMLAHGVRLVRLAELDVAR